MDTRRKYAEVYADIRSLGVDHPFDYIIPPSMIPFINIGSVVMVPLLNRTEVGYVVAIKDSTDVDVSLKAIKGLVDIPTVFDNDRLKLSSWMSSYYVQPITSVLRLFLPPGRKSKKALEEPRSQHKYRTVVRLGDIGYDSSHSSWIKKKAQKRILDVLTGSGNCQEKSALLEKASSGSGALKSLEDSGYAVLEKERVLRDFRYESGTEDKEIVLNSYQEECVRSINEALNTDRKFLIHGVTGSGKTEIYMNISKKVLQKGKKVLMLVPEIFLTHQLFSRFDNMFGTKVAVYHSHMSEGERYDRWLKILTGEVELIIGTRSALFLPVRDLGIIIMDEEHDPSYKENSLVRYNTKDVAGKLSNIKKIPLVMGSATPSIGTRFLAGSRDDYTLLKVPVKAQNSKVVRRQVVDLKKIDSKKEDQFITGILFRAMKQELDKGNKVIIFINRRGFSNFVVCTGCGKVPICPACELAYNYHRDVGKLICHHCSSEEKYTGICGVCGNESLFLAGSGVQRVEAKIRQRFADVPVFRMDSDITTRKKSHQTIISGFSKPGKAILAGTQMIAKGLDIPDVTLVGVINCDGMLSLPDYHMDERVYQLITQVSGRAGRKDKEGKVILQTYRPDSGVISHGMDEDYESFYREELKRRKELSYPPFSSLVNIVVSGLDEDAVVAEVIKVLDKIYKDIKMDNEILGPAPAPFYRINKYYRRHILIKTKDIDRLTGLLGESLKSYRKNRDIRIIIDVDPVWIL